MYQQDSLSNKHLRHNCHQTEKNAINRSRRHVQKPTATAQRRYTPYLIAVYSVSRGHAPRKYICLIQCHKVCLHETQCTNNNFPNRSLQPVTSAQGLVMKGREEYNQVRRRDSLVRQSSRHNVIQTDRSPQHWVAVVWLGGSGLLVSICDEIRLLACIRRLQADTCYLLL